MSDEKKPFKITDRRHFTAEGDVRREEEPRPAPPPRDAPRAEPAAERPAPAPTVERVAPAPAPPSQPASPRGRGGEPEVDFGGFVVSLATQAGFLLEGGATPEGEVVPPDLAGARQIIAILEMLKTKTEGRRTPEEDRILDGVLYELRMGYLARSGVVGA